MQFQHFAVHCICSHYISTASPHAACTFKSCLHWHSAENACKIRKPNVYNVINISCILNVYVCGTYCIVQQLFHWCANRIVTIGMREMHHMRVGGCVCVCVSVYRALCTVIYPVKWLNAIWKYCYMVIRILNKIYGRNLIAKMIVSLTNPHHASSKAICIYNCKQLKWNGIILGACRNTDQLISQSYSY